MPQNTDPLRATVSNPSETGDVAALTAWLVIPLAILLFAQWPLRELVQAYSRQANDVAQALFAVYVAVAVTAASRAKAHLAASSGHGSGQDSGPGWRDILLFVCVAPWGLFMLWASIPHMQSSVMKLEKFPETLTPGFFIVKLALGLMLVLIVLDTISALRAALRRRL